MDTTVIPQERALASECRDQSSLRRYYRQCQCEIADPDRPAGLRDDGGGPCELPDDARASVAPDGVSKSFCSSGLVADRSTGCLRSYPRSAGGSRRAVISVLRAFPWLLLPFTDNALALPRPGPIRNPTLSENTEIDVLPRVALEIRHQRVGTVDDGAEIGVEQRIREKFPSRSAP